MTHLSSGIVSAFNELTAAREEMHANNLVSGSSSKNSSSNISHQHPIMISGNKEEDYMTMETGGGLYMEGCMDFVIGTDDDDDDDNLQGNHVNMLNQHHSNNNNNNNKIDMSLDDNNMDGDVAFISTMALQTIGSDCVPLAYPNNNNNNRVKGEHVSGLISGMESTLNETQHQHRQSQSQQQQQQQQQQSSQPQQQQQSQNFSISMANGSTNSDPFIYSYTSWQNLPAPGCTNGEISPAVSITGEPLLVNNLQHAPPPPPPPPQQYFSGFSDGNMMDAAVLYSQQQQQQSQQQQQHRQHHHHHHQQQQQQQQYMDDAMIRSNLFVSGLHPSVTDVKLHELFQPYGRIESAKVMLDIHTGKSRGIAFVKFDNVNSAEQAVAALNNSVHLGETIAVRVAKPHAAYRPGAPTNKTFVRNVPLTVKKSDLAAHFSRYGDVIDVSIHSDTAQRATNKKRNVVFVTYTTKEAAARAAQETHTTMPFQDCEGIPLLAKVAEDSAHRIERLARRGAGRGGKSGDNCGGVPHHPLHNIPHHPHHSMHVPHKGMDPFASASISSSYPFPPTTAPPPTTTTVCVSPILTTDPYGTYTAPPATAFYATPFIPMPPSFNGGNNSTTSLHNNNNNHSSSPCNISVIGNGSSSSNILNSNNNNNNNNNNGNNHHSNNTNSNNNNNNNNNGGGGFAPILVLGPDAAPPPPPPMYTSYDGSLHSPAQHLGNSTTSSSNNNNNNNNNNTINTNNNNNNNANGSKLTDHISPLMMCPTRHAAMMAPTPTVMYYMSNGQMALGPPSHA